VAEVLPLDGCDGWTIVNDPTACPDVSVVGPMATATIA
jgi:hypothetical protein